MVTEYSDEAREEMALTPDEVAALVKKAPARARFYLRCQFDTPIAGSDNEVFRDAGRISIKITRAELLRRLPESLSAGLVERGARIPVCKYTRVYASNLQPYIAYWIG